MSALQPVFLFVLVRFGCGWSGSTCNLHRLSVFLEGERPVALPPADAPGKNFLILRNLHTATVSYLQLLGTTSLMLNIRWSSQRLNLVMIVLI